MSLMIDCLLLVMALLRAIVRDRTDLIVENLLLRHQLGVLTRPTRKRPRLRTRDKLVWVLASLVRRDWRRHLVVVAPDTVVRWPRRGWRLFWRWRSRVGIGRPRVSLQIRQLIATMARDNPRVGRRADPGRAAEAGIAVSKASVQRYRRRGPACPPTQSWGTFLRNHRP